MDIVEACDCARLLDRATRSFATVFRIRASQEVVAQNPRFVHALMDKVERMYAADAAPTQQDCGGTVYLLMVVLHNDGVRKIFLAREVSQGHPCVAVWLA